MRRWMAVAGPVLGCLLLVTAAQARGPSSELRPDYLRPVATHQSLKAQAKEELKKLCEKEQKEVAPYDEIVKGVEQLAASEPAARQQPDTRAEGSSPTPGGASRQNASAATAAEGQPTVDLQEGRMNRLRAMARILRGYAAIAGADPTKPDKALDTLLKVAKPQSKRNPEELKKAVKALARLFGAKETNENETDENETNESEKESKQRNTYRGFLLAVTPQDGLEEYANTLLLTEKPYNDWKTWFDKNLPKALLDVLRAGAAEKLRPENLQTAPALIAQTLKNCDLYPESLQCLARAEHLCSAVIRESTGALASGAVAGISWQATVLNGLADFMYQRTQEELVMWLITSYRSRVCGSAEKPGEGLAWFPKSCELLGEDKPWNELPPGAVFAAAVRKDLESFPFQIASTVARNELRFAQIIQLVQRGQYAQAQERMLPLLDELREAGKKDCALNSDVLTIPCGLGAAAAVAVEIKDVIKADWQDNVTARTVCEAAKKTLQDSKFKEIWEQNLKQKLPGLKELFDKAADIKCTELPQQGAMQNLISWLKQLNKLHQAIKEIPGKPEKERPAAAVNAIRIAIEGFDAAWQLASGALPDARIKNAELALIGSANLAEALYSLVAQARQGVAPVSLLAGFGQSLGTNEICHIEELKGSVLCRLAGMGSLLAFIDKFNDLIDQGDENVKVNQERICETAKEIAKSDKVKTALTNLYGPGKLPDLLTDLFDQAKPPTDCKSGDSQGVQAFAALVTNAVKIELLVRTGANKDRHQLVRDILVAVLQTVKQGMQLTRPGHANDDEAVQDGLEKTLQTLADVMDAASVGIQGDYAESIRKMLEIMARYAEHLPPAVRRYVVLFGDLAMARTVSDVQAILEKAAAPAGSWRVKRERSVSLTVTAIVGFALGGEWTPATTADSGGMRLCPDAAPHTANRCSGFSVGAFAPLGLELAWPLPHKSSFGLFVSMIDLGQLLWQRVTDTGKQQDPATGEAKAATASEVSFLNVLSPGMYLKWGLGRSPLTAGMGASYSPALRKYFYASTAGAGATPDALSAFRFIGFVGVDLTLLPVWVGGDRK